MMTEAEAFEAYWQACKDMDPMIDERAARTYFKKWWDKRASGKRPIDEHPWYID